MPAWSTSENRTGSSYTNAGTTGYVLAGRCSRTPHDAGTPGQGGASFSSSIVTAARGYSSWILRADRAGERLEQLVASSCVPSATTTSLTFQ